MKIFGFIIPTMNKWQATVNGSITQRSSEFRPKILCFEPNLGFEAVLGQLIIKINRIASVKAGLAKMFFRIFNPG